MDKSQRFGFKVSDGVILLGSHHFGGVLDWVDDGSGGDGSTGLSGGDGGQVLLGGGHYFRGLSDGGGQDAGAFGQGVGDDAESVGVGDVADADLFAFGADVSVATHLVSPSVLVVGGSLAGVRVAVACLTEFILSAVLAGRVRGVSVTVMVVRVGCR